MTVAVRDVVTFGHGQSTTVDTQHYEIPTGVQDGDVALLSINAHGGGGVIPTLTSVPAEFDLVRYAEVPGTNGGWLYSIDLTAAMVGTTFDFVLSNTRRNQGVMLIASGATLTGMISNEIVEDVSSTSQTIPSLASVPAGAMVVGLLNVRRGGNVAAVTTWPGDWTQDGFARSSYSNSPNISTTVAHKVAASAGTYGGQTASTDLATVGVDFIAALPAAATNLDDLRLGSGTVDLRYGATAVDRAYLGSTQIWP